MERQTLGAIAAAEPLDRQLAVAPHDLEHEQVLPFGPGGVQPGHPLLFSSECEKAIVLHGSLPEIGRRSTVGQVELAEKPARQVDQVRALIDQFAAAGNLRLEAPFLLVADAPSVPVAAANEQQRSDAAFIGKGLSPCDRRMEAVVEADLDDAS